MAEAARRYMSHQRGAVTAAGSDWATAYTRTLLGVRLDVDGEGDWSMVMTSAEPPAVRAGDRAPDLVLHGPLGRETIHGLCRDSFVALYFTDVRRRPEIPVNDSPALRHFAISTWIEAGLAPKTVQTFAGHSSLQVTMDRYGHLFKSDDHKAAMEAIAKTLFK